MQVQQLEIRIEDCVGYKQSLKKTVFNISIHCLFLSASIGPAAQPTGCGFGSFEY